MKAKKLLAGFLSAAIVLSSMAMPVFADETKVAQIGDTKYATLAEALGAAKNGNTVELLENVTLTNSINLSVNGNITLDLGGKTLSNDANATECQHGMIMLKSGTNLTLKNGEIDVKMSKDEYSNYKSGSQTCVDVEKNSRLTVDGTHLKGTSQNSFFTVCDGGSLVINSGDYTVTEGGTVVFTYGKDSTVEINGGTFTGTDDSEGAVYAFNDANVTVNGGNFNFSDDKSDYTSFGVTTGTEVNWLFCDYSKMPSYPFNYGGVEVTAGGHISVTGGTYNKDICNLNNFAWGKVNGVNQFKVATINYVAGGYKMETRVETEGTKYIVNPAAEIDGVYYGSVAEAIDAAGEEKTVKLCRDVTEPDAAGAEITHDLTKKTLDLNNYTYSTNNFSHIFEGTGGTIKNGKMVGLNDASYALFIGNGSTITSFTVDSVQFTGGINAYCATGVVLKNSTSASATNYYAVWADWLSDVTIESGTYTANNTSILGATSYIPTNSEEVASKITVKDGVFKSNPAFEYDPKVPTRDSVFYKYINSAANRKYGGDLTVYGGTFDVDVVEKYLADGAVMTKNSDSTYTVSQNAIINVDSSNAQDYLDGKYGDITGKTINFTENITDILDLARPTKYAGSGTTYYIGTETDKTQKTDIADLTGGSILYYRTLKDVTFTADEGVEIAGFKFGTGHIYGSDKGTAYDYVRDVTIVDTNNGYYRHSSLNNLTFKGLTITKNFTAGFNSVTDCKVDGLIFDGCTFKGSDSYKTNVQAIGMQANSNYYQNITVKNCTIDNYFQGVYIQGVDTATVTGNTVSNITHNALAFQGGTDNPVKGTVTVTENYIENDTDRAFRFANITANTTVTVKNNVIVNSGDTTDSSNFKSGTVDSSSTVNLDYNYWNGKEISVGICDNNTGLATKTTKKGIAESTWNRKILNDYVADGYKAFENSDGTYSVVEAKAEVVNTDDIKASDVTGDTDNTATVTVTLDDLYKNTKVDLTSNTTYKVVVDKVEDTQKNTIDNNIKTVNTNDTNSIKRHFDIKVVETTTSSDSEASTTKDVDITNQLVTITLDITPDPDTVCVYHTKTTDGSPTTEQIEVIRVNGKNVTVKAPSFSDWTATFEAQAPAWTTDTDSGCYTLNDANYGMMRFMFKAVPADGTVTASGIKYLKGSGITENVEAAVNTSVASEVFQGDIVKISPEDASTYYAKAYITTKYGTFWSDLMSCKLNTERFFSGYFENGSTESSESSY